MTALGLRCSNEPIYTLLARSWTSPLHSKMYDLKYDKRGAIWVTKFLNHFSTIKCVTICYKYWWRETMLRSISAKMVALYKEGGAWPAECRRKQTCTPLIYFIRMNFRICCWQELSGLPAQYLRSCITTIFHSSCRIRRYCGNIPLDW